MTDQFQQRYLEHRSRKSEGLSEPITEERQKQVSDRLEHLIELMRNRRSQRRFNQVELTEEEIEYILEAVRLSPSSCNRQAIYLVEANKFLMSQLLVGGKDWTYKADKVYLVMASREAYKNPAERQFMPFLDAGFVSQNVYLMCEALDIGCCFVNPNIRERDIPIFNETYGEDYFCGALVIGNYNKKAEKPPLRERKEVLKKS